MTDLARLLAVFLTRMAGGYALCLVLVGPAVREGSWRRVSSFVIAGLCAVAIGAGAPWLPCVALGVAALLFERAHTFGLRVVSSPLWLAPFAVWAALANEWPPVYETIPSAIAIGGTLGAMLLGHSYLTARGLSFRPLARMAWILFVLLGLRAVSVVPAWFGDGIEWMDYVFLSLRCALGLVLPLAMAWMVIQCVRIESNQSATGILYAMTVLVGVFGELIAVYLRYARGIAA